MSWYQKGKTSLDFTEARDSEWQWHQLGHMQVCTSLLPAPHHWVFYRPDALPAAQPTASKHWKKKSNAVKYPRSCSRYATNAPFLCFFATHCVLNLQFCLILLSAICLFVCWAVSSILLLNLCQVNLCTFEAWVYVGFCACLGWSQHNDWSGSGWRYWWLQWNGWYYGHSVYIINSLIVNLYWFLTWLERCHSRL